MHVLQGRDKNAIWNVSLKSSTRLGDVRKRPQLRPMSEAPRDGAPVRLHLRDGSSFLRQQLRGRVPSAAVVATDPVPRRPVIVKARKPRPRR